jgi:hypothetical protein
MNVHGEIQVAIVVVAYLTLRAVQFDQTPVSANLRIICREEVGQSLQGRVRFLLRARLQHGNHSDCSSGALSDRRRWLGIFAVAQLTELPDQHAHVLPDPIRGMPGGSSTPKIDLITGFRVPRTKSPLRRCIFQED